MSAPTAAQGIANLRDDSLPPLHVPLRFFVTATVFLVLVGTLWLWQGELVFVARWSPGMLASTHLLTLGFFTMIMFGALFQVVPVLGGRPVPRPGLVATITHLGLSGGTLLLSAGLWAMSPGRMQFALVLLGCALVVFVPTVAVCLLRRHATALRPVRFAGLAFVVTIGLGVLMASAIAWPGLGIAFRAWTDLHAACGGLGWGMLLVIGVGYQVVPMFHVTPPFPNVATRWTVPAVVLGLVLLALPAPAPIFGTVAIAGFGLAHVAVTLSLLHRRRRRRPDATVLAWQCGLVILGIALLLALADAVLPATVRPSSRIGSFDLLLAVLFALGGLGTIVLGMLTKIVPFLAFLHLQRRALPVLAATRELPPMAEFLGLASARAQVVLHLVTAAAIAATVLHPPLTAVAGALLIADGALCASILLRAASRYRRAARAIDRILDTAKATSQITT
ncbi:MAG: NnrS family protein [Planctomycetes bacterium]|nr:NnrS family protein [Planctomycetota bacterium]